MLFSQGLARWTRHTNRNHKKKKCVQIVDMMKWGDVYVAHLEGVSSVSILSETLSFFWYRIVSNWASCQAARITPPYSWFFYYYRMHHLGFIPYLLKCAFLKKEIEFACLLITADEKWNNSLTNEGWCNPVTTNTYMLWFRFEIWIHASVTHVSSLYSWTSKSKGIHFI